MSKKTNCVSSKRCFSVVFCIFCWFFCCCFLLNTLRVEFGKMTSSQYVVVIGDFFFFLQNRNRETFFCVGGDWIFLLLIFQKGALFLPKFTLLLLSRDFNNSRFVNDTRSALSLFHNTDNPSLVTFLLFDVLKIKNKGLVKYLIEMLFNRIFCYKLKLQCLGFFFIQ